MPLERQLKTALITACASLHGRRSIRTTPYRGLAMRKRLALYVLSAYTLAVCYGAWTEPGLSGALIMAPIAILALVALRTSLRRDA